MSRWAIPLAVVALFAATVSGYGVFRDELYYVACGRHLAWGYVDHPPFVALVAAVFGPSWIALRLVTAVAFGATVLLIGDTARAMGGDRRAGVFAQLLAATAPGYLALFSIFSMNAFDVLVWAGLARLGTAILTGGSLKLWIAFGALAGVGLQNKVDVGLLGAGLAAGIALSRRFDLLKTRWIWIGGGIAAAIFAPHVAWQVAHGFPTREFVENAQRGKIAQLSLASFLGAQLWIAGPVACAAAVAGLGWLVASARARYFRPLGWAALAALVVLTTSVSKPYYFAPAYTLLFPAAGIVISGLAPVLRIVSAVAIVATLGLAPLAKPLLSADAYVRYAARLGLGPSSDENHAMGRLPQFFADMHGWREMADSVAKAASALAPEDRAKACVYGQNYGEAAAIDYFGRELRLPPAISGHNAYWTWGPGACTGEIVLIIGGDREDHLEEFATVEAAGVHRAADAMPYENDLTIWIARGLKVPLADAWAGTRHYD